jgi:TonB family protein
MPHTRTAKSNLLFVFLAAAALLISGISSASPGTSAQQEEQVPKSIIGIGVTVLSYLPKGADFEPYMRDMHSSIMGNLSANLPESVKNGQKGIVVLRARIQKDGSLSDDAVTITTSSRKDDMDAATLNAIRAASPFGPLPEGYSGSDLELNFAFCFNIPQKPAQKSKPVTPVN